MSAVLYMIAWLVCMAAAMWGTLKVAKRLLRFMADDQFRSDLRAARPDKGGIPG